MDSAGARIGARCVSRSCATSRNEGRCKLNQAATFSDRTLGTLKLVAEALADGTKQVDLYDCRQDLRRADEVLAVLNAELSPHNMRVESADCKRFAQRGGGSVIYATLILGESGQSVLFRLCGAEYGIRFSDEVSPEEYEESCRSAAERDRQRRDEAAGKADVSCLCERLHQRMLQLLAACDITDEQRADATYHLRHIKLGRSSYTPEDLNIVATAAAAIGKSLADLLSQQSSVPRQRKRS